MPGVSFLKVFLNIFNIMLAIGLLQHSLTPAVAQEKGTPTIAGDQLTWTTEQTHLKARITVTGPGDLLHERFLEPGESLTIDLASQGRAPLPDGQYHWRIELTSPLFADQQEALSQAQQKGDPNEIDRILRSVEFRAITRAGSLRRSDGRWIESKTFAPTEDGQGKMDLIVDGRLGIGGQAPAREIHIVDGTTPTIRFEQDTTGGSAPQVWDVEANELGFLFRDETHTKVPFSIGSNGQGVRVAERLSIQADSGANWSFIGQDNKLRISRDGTGQSELVIDDSGDLVIAGGFNVGVLATTAVEVGDYRLTDQGDSLDISGGSGRARLRDDNPELTVESTNSTVGARTLLRLQNQGTPILELKDSTTNSSWNLSAGAQGFSFTNGKTGQSMTLSPEGSLALPGGLAAIDSFDVGSYEIRDDNGELVISEEGSDNSVRFNEGDFQTAFLVKNDNETATTRVLMKLQNNGPPYFMMENTEGPDNRWSLGVHATELVISKAATGVNELRMDGSGNMFIAGELTVCSGSSSCTPQTTYPDYVFDDGYELMPLSQLKTFIEEQGHLPKVPTVADVVRDGISMTKIQLLLLEKVEELTLYTLDQHDIIGRQETLIQQLENRVHALEAAAESPKLESAGDT